MTLRSTDVLTVLMIAAAVGIAAANVASRNRLSAGRTAEPDPLPLLVVDRAEEYAAGRHKRGSRTAEVILVEFSDFQCPACAQLAPIIDEVLRNRSDVLHLYRHLPLVDIHPHSLQAAEASECAAAQGRFFEMHDVLYDDQAAIGVKPWSQFASSAQVRDIVSFENCMKNHIYASAVQDDRDLAKRLDARGTPTLLINDLLVRGVRSANELDSLLTRARQ